MELALRAWSGHEGVNWGLAPCSRAGVPWRETGENHWWSEAAAGKSSGWKESWKEVIPCSRVRVPEESPEDTISETEAMLLISLYKWEMFSRAPRVAEFFLKCSCFTFSSVHQSKHDSGTSSIRRLDIWNHPTSTGCRMTLVWTVLLTTLILLYIPPPELPELLGNQVYCQWQWYFERSFFFFLFWVLSLNRGLKIFSKPCCKQMCCLWALLLHL